MSARITQNLRTYGAFAGSEAVMMAAAKAGGDRQALHETIRDAAMDLARGDRARRGQPALATAGRRPATTALLDPAEVRRLLDPAHYVGDAPERARALAEKIARSAVPEAARR